MRPIRHLPFLLTLFISLTTITTHALPTELIPVPKGGVGSFWIKGSLLGIPYIYLITGAICGLLLFIVVVVLFYFRKRRRDRRHAKLVEESSGEMVLLVTNQGEVEAGTGPGAAHSGGGCREGNGHVVTYLYHEQPPSQYPPQQHTTAFVGQAPPPYFYHERPLSQHSPQQHTTASVGQAQPQMSEIRHSMVYYSEKAPIQIQTHDPVTGYPFPQGKVQFFELSTNAAAATTTAANTVTSSQVTKRNGDGNRGEGKTPISLDQLPERLYSHPPSELHHKLPSPAHVHLEGSGSEVGLKNGKAVTAAAATQSQAKKDVSSFPAGSKDSKGKSKVQLKDILVLKNIKTKKATTTTTEPKPFT